MQTSIKRNNAFAPAGVHDSQKKQKDHVQTVDDDAWWDAKQYDRSWKSGSCVPIQIIRGLLMTQ